MLKVVHDDSLANATSGSSSLLDEIVRDGARQMLAAALQAEVAAYSRPTATMSTTTAGGWWSNVVMPSGRSPPRPGAVPVKQPRVNDRRIDAETGQRLRFASSILPAWVRKSPQVAEVLPLLYLHGLSSGDFGPALE